jgi:hypothetical protein
VAIGRAAELRITVAEPVRVLTVPAPSAGQAFVQTAKRITMAKKPCSKIRVIRAFSAIVAIEGAAVVIPFIIAFLNGQITI